jgi:rhodanese-related sulfurtransferase
MGRPGRVVYAPLMAQPTRRYHLPSALRVSPARIEPTAARALLERATILIDVRRHDDPSMTVPGALRIPPDEIPARLGELPHGVPIVLVCT